MLVQYVVLIWRKPGELYGTDAVRLMFHLPHKGAGNTDLEDIMTKAALFAAALLIGLPAASYAQMAPQGATTTVQSGTGGAGPAPKVKRTQKAKRTKATKVKRTTTTGTSETPRTKDCFRLESGRVSGARAADEWS